MQIATFKISDEKQANKFMKDVEVKNLFVGEGIIAVQYEPILSAEEFRKQEILRTIRQTERNLEVAKINVEMFSIEAIYTTGTKQVDNKKHVETSKEQVELFEKKIARLTLMLNGKD